MKFRVFAQEKVNKMTPELAQELGIKLGIDWSTSEFSPEDLAAGLEVELEHGKRDPETNVTDDDVLTTAKIAWAHLKERADYYRKLKEMEKQPS